MIPELVIGAGLVGVALAWGVAVLVTIHTLEQRRTHGHTWESAPSPSASIVLSGAWNVEREECGASIVIARMPGERGRRIVCLAALTNAGGACRHSRCRALSQGH